MDRFNIRFIPEFGGSATGPSVVEWFEKAERICKWYKINEPATVIPLRLTGGAYAVYQQLGDEPDWDEIKHSLYTAFGTDPFVAWQQFIYRRLHLRETVDVYLADLRKLSVPFSGVIDKILSCAFLVGLPEDISRLLWASSRIDELTTAELLARARNILKEPEPITAAARTSRAASEHYGDNVYSLPAGDILDYGWVCKNPERLRNGTKACKSGERTALSDRSEVTRSWKFLTWWPVDVYFPFAGLGWQLRLSSAERAQWPRVGTMRPEMPISVACWRKQWPECVK